MNTCDRCHEPVDIDHAFWYNGNILSIPYPTASDQKPYHPVCYMKWEIETMRQAGISEETIKRVYPELVE